MFQFVIINKLLQRIANSFEGDNGDQPENPIKFELQVVSKNTLILINMIKQNLCKFNVEKYKPQMQRFYLIHDVLQPVIDLFKLYTKSIGVTLEFKNKSVCEMLVLIDKIRIQQILILLIQN